MEKLYKYPRTFHIPQSLSFTSDDKVHKNINFFENKEVVITIKMDGENSTILKERSYARSLDSKHHSSRDWLKQFVSNFASDIPENYRICGENLYAKHSIEYNDLESYFYGFSIWDKNNNCLNWDSTIEWFKLLGIIPVPVLYQGIYSEKIINDLIKNFDVINHEGFVIRIANSFHYDDFSKNVAKWVRANHVRSDKHWKQTWTANKLKG